MSDPPSDPVRFDPPDTFNIADYFLGDRLREGRGDRRALLFEADVGPERGDGAAATGGEGDRDGIRGGAGVADRERGRTRDLRSMSYFEVHDLAGRYASLLDEAGVRPEERVLIALPDGPDYAAALFGTWMRGAVAVMLNPHLRPDEIEYFFAYTRGAVLLVDGARWPAFGEVIERVREGGGPGLESRLPREVLVVDDPGFRARLREVAPRQEAFPTHRDDPAAWIFSGGTTGRPKAAVQTHTSFANSTECYAKRVVGYREDDVTLAVPKLFFGYATGSNLLFPFAAGAAAALFPERSTPEVVFDKIEHFRPTILVNVPTMINQMLAHPGAAERDLSSLRLATSAGEALPPALHRRWSEAYGVELLDGLGTAEMWHIFLSNRPGDVRPGTLGKAVPGFDARVRDEDGSDLPPGEVGWLWVRGNSRALGYWQQAEKSRRAFRGEWYVSGDMVARDDEGVFTYAGRADDMLKVKGKWLSPREVEDCLLRHAGVGEAAVVGAENEDGLVRPVAWVVPASETEVAGLADELRAFVGDRLPSYKVPEAIHFVHELPRTHLGKVDRGRLRSDAG